VGTEVVLEAMEVMEVMEVMEAMEVAEVIHTMEAMLGVGPQVEWEVPAMDTLCLHPLLRDTRGHTQTQLLPLQFLAVLVSLRWAWPSFCCSIDLSR
jgi:hypothetical protein